MQPPRREWARWRRPMKLPRRRPSAPCPGDTGEPRRRLRAPSRAARTRSIASRARGSAPARIKDRDHARWPSRSALATVRAQFLADQKRVESGALTHRIGVGTIEILVARLEAGERFEEALARLIERRSRSDTTAVGEHPLEHRLKRIGRRPQLAHEIVRGFLEQADHIAAGPPGGIARAEHLLATGERQLFARGLEPRLAAILDQLVGHVERRSIR